MADNTKVIGEIRKMVLTASYEAKVCHIGSALSCIEILVDLFWNILTDKDVFIFSKASGAGAYYAVLAKRGFFPEEKLAYYLKNYPLVSKEVPGVIWSGGSLGHGLPVAVGMALADRTRNVYVLMSDAEVQEGTTWESLLFAHQHKLENLKIIVDKNGLQACGRIKDILDIPWDIFTPPMEIVETTKGKGVSFMENNNEWHYRAPEKDEYDRAMQELESNGWNN